MNCDSGKDGIVWNLTEAPFIPKEKESKIFKYIIWHTPNAADGTYTQEFRIQYGLRNIPAMAAAPPAAGAAAVGPAPNILTYLEFKS